MIHVDGEVDPIRDLETIGEELRLKDEEQLMQNIEKLDRVVNRGGDKKLKPEYVSISHKLFFSIQCLYLTNTIYFPLLKHPTNHFPI